MTPEIHLFIIWSNGLHALDQVYADISNSFDVIEQLDVTWSKSKFSENLSRFYGENLPRGSFKEKHCGSDKFRVVIVKDLCPEYQVRKTSKGRRLVNCHVFDAKQLYRLWTLGGHKVHATDNIAESKYQLSMLFGYDYEILMAKPLNSWLSIWKNDLVGSFGWETIESVFLEANKCCNYVVMRNYEKLENEVDALHPDIDVLCDDRGLFVRMINGIPTTNSPYRAQYYVYVGIKKIFFDVRSVNDNYYDARWSRDILRSRSSYNNLYVPSKKNYFFSLIYHALLHKSELTQDYSDRLTNMFYEQYHELASPSTEMEWVSFLVEFMDKQGYLFVEPRDLTVYWNYWLIENLKAPKLSTLREKSEMKKRFKQKLKDKVSSFLRMLPIK